MSIARHHAEWLSLLEISGPFLSMPVLLRAFPQGLDADDPAHAGELRAAYEEWADNQGGLSPDPAIHTAWIRYVLRQTLELPDELLAERQGIPESLKATLPEHGETLRPDLILLPSPVATGEGPGVRAPRLLIQIYPAHQSLDKTLPDRPWKANPATRMMELLRQTGVRLGLATNGEAWLLVSAKAGETTSYITWYAGLWGEERLTLRAFRSLLGLRRFFGVPDDQTLAALLDASAVDQQEVTDQLGYQVRRAVEILVASLDRADQDAGRGLLTGISESVLYEASLTVMMRLVFLLSAEERGLLLLGDPLYDQHYAASTLRAQLHEQADQQGEEVLERRYDAWSRLLATFRAVHCGIQHENLRLPAYGGSLFDPDRFPFLEGRAAGTRWRETQGRTATPHPLPINNRTVLHLLDALQMLKVKVPGGGPAEARRLSFRALDIEQIGHVYEGLLDHTARRAAEPILGLAGTRDKEPEIPLAKLEEMGSRKDAKTQREQEDEFFAPFAPLREDFVAFLKDQTGRSESALRKALADEGPKTKDENGSRITQYAARLRAACNNDVTLHHRVLPFAGLIRDDDFGRPWVIPAGSVYVTAGTDRRSSGTHYTPRVLTEPIVEHTLEPLVYNGPAEGWPREKWQLRTAAELLELKICDMAMGSGAFLVQSDRYLAERLVEAWELRIADFGLRIDIYGEPIRNPQSKIENHLPADPDDRLILARRLVAERCLYGVDKNPLAVEMAKLSLWLVTMAKGQPFDFLDHALKCGDSLVGADEKMFLAWSRTLKGTIGPLYFEENERALTLAREKRRQLRAFLVNDVRDAEVKARLLAEADAAVARVKRGCDLLVGVQLVEWLSDAERETWLAELLIEHTAKETLTSDKAQRALAAARKHNAFHWFLEFPEVFEGSGVLIAPRSGFHAFVGNPPFMGGQFISGQLGSNYLRFLKSRWHHASGSADYCAYFFLQTFQNLRVGGTLGLIGTNTIAQGDTRELSLDHITQDGATIYYAANSMRWPGTANVFVSIVHIYKGHYNGVRFLDERSVPHISSRLDDIEEAGNPYGLAGNADKSFQGSIILGLGFTLNQQEAEALTTKNQRNSEVLFRYLDGQDLNSSPDQTPRRWAINFSDWPLSKAEAYPDCLAIVRETVYLQRQALKDTSSTNRHRKERWWQYGSLASNLYSTITANRRVLVIARTSKTVAFVFVPNGMVYNENTVVFAFETAEHFALLQSTIHRVWVERYSSTLKSDQGYRSSDCFETFPFPKFPASSNQLLATLGETYHEHRRQIMLARQEGLTTTYNRFHNPDERSQAADIARLRELHVEMDRAVAAAYGWQDLDLGHGFHETAQGVRFTISEAARREVLGRLLELNHQRYAEEVAAGMHEKGKKAPTTATLDEAKAVKAEMSSDTTTSKKRARRKISDGMEPLL